MSERPDRERNDRTGGEQDTDIRYVNLYDSDSKVYVRRITGFYQKLRRYTGIPLLLGFALMPWLVVDGRPAMLFDLPSRQFHVLWITFRPQDGMYLAWLLIIAAFLLFTVTVLVGRVWCGFTCPQTVWTHMYIWAEHLCEGDRNKRIKLDRKPWDLEKLLRKGSKHGVWLLIALMTALTFVGYFVPIRELILGLVTLDVHLAAAFWVLFFTLATYMNAGFLREQVCKYMCPYARFQSVMYDEETLTVAYNHHRGEPRGPRKPGEDHQAMGLGDCIDCSWCVQVCPVDIDIRDGLQAECIDCGLCVDACNTVMDRMAYPRGLISFTTEERIATGKSRVLRPRFLAYLAVLVVMIAVFTYALNTRLPVLLDVTRDRGAQMYRLSGEEVQNVYTVKIENMDRRVHQYELSVEGGHPFEIQGYRDFPIEPGEHLAQPIRVAVPRDALTQVRTTITLRVQSLENPEIATETTTTFIGPGAQD